MKRLLLLCLIPLFIAACDDKNSNNNGGSGGNSGGNDKTLDDLFEQGKLTSDETNKIKEICKDDREENEEIEGCINSITTYLTILKGIGCHDKYMALYTCNDEQCEHEREDALFACFTQNIKPYSKAIENSDLYKAFMTYIDRDENCCSTWHNDASEYCGDDNEEPSEQEEIDHTVEVYISILTYINSECSSKLEKYYTCIGKQACDQPATEEDSTSEALCYDEDSSIYIGDNYSDSGACYDSLTFHCKNEGDALYNCVKEYGLVD